MNGISPEVADHRISLVQVQIVGEVDVPPFEPFHEVERLKGSLHQPVKTRSSGCQISQDLQGGP